MHQLIGAGVGKKDTPFPLHRFGDSLLALLFCLVCDKEAALGSSMRMLLLPAPATFAVWNSWQMPFFKGQTRP